jgi:hypothetical protein
MTEYAKQATVEAARAIIDGRLGFIEGCVRLASLAHDVVPDWRVDKDFVEFGVFASDTDHLPYGGARLFWNKSALAEADGEIQAREDDNRDAILQACRNVIQRFQDA